MYITIYNTVCFLKTVPKYKFLGTSTFFFSFSFSKVQKVKYQKVRATKNFIKDKMTGRVNIILRIFEKIAKKLKMKSQEQKNVVLVNLSENFPKIYFFGSCYFNFDFLAVFSKIHQSKSTVLVILFFL